MEAVTTFTKTLSPVHHLILLRLTAPLVAEFSDRQRLFLWTISLALGMMLGTSCELYSMLLKLLPSESGSSPVSH